MRVSAIFLVALVLVAVSCATQVRRSPGSPEDSTPKRDRHGRPILEAPMLEKRTFMRDTPTTVVGFGAGSLWIVDYGDYRCDDTPGIASCSTPRKVFLKRVEPKSREVLASIPLRNTEGVDVAFGAGAVWIAYEDFVQPSRSAVLRLDPGTNRITHSIPLKPNLSISFGDGAVWTASYHGAVTRIDPQTNEVTDTFDLGHDGIYEIDAGEGSVWVTSSGDSRHPERNALLRLDPETGEVVARIPVAPTAAEGGAASVAVDEEARAVWVTSNNGKLLRVNPETNEATEELALGDYAYGIEIGDGSVYSQVELGTLRPGWTTGIAQVDKGSNEISGRADIPDASGLALGSGAVWAGSSNVEKGSGSLVEVAP